MEISHRQWDCSHYPIPDGGGTLGGMSVAKQIERRMSVLQLNAKGLSKKARLNDTAVRDIIEGRSKNPRHDTLEKIAKALGCTAADLMGERSPARVAHKDIGDGNIVINELDVHVASGMGADGETAIMANEEAGAIVGTFSFPHHGFREMVGASPAGVRMLAVRGDSMQPTLFPGQKVMVDTNDRTPSPPGVFVIWDGLSLVLKRIELVAGSDPMRVRISSDNDKYTAYERTLEEAHINGRVVGVWARL